MPEGQQVPHRTFPGGRRLLCMVQLGLAALIVLSVAVPVAAAPEAQRTGEERPNITVSGEGEVRPSPTWRSSPLA
jgi:uncharacterized protein YggE